MERKNKMLKFNYKTETAKYDISFTKNSENVVTIAGEFPIKTDGFYLNREGHEDFWDYTEYTTIYKELENGAMFSNDGSVAPPEPEPQPEPDPVPEPEEEPEEE